MTRKERDKPVLIKGSRCDRIARGAGVSLVDVKELLRTFEQIKQFVKLMNAIEDAR